MLQRLGLRVHKALGGEAALEIFREHGAGIDLVIASVSFTLTDFDVENLTLTGAAGIDGTGNDLANILTGNSADNALNGGAGADSCSGGPGADTVTGC